MTNGSLMKVESISECSFCNTFDLHSAIILETNFCSTLEWPLKTGFTVLYISKESQIHVLTDKAPS